MAQFKAQLHTHSRQDPREKVSYSEIELIDHAAALEYDVLAITCHNVLIYNDYLAAYAKQKGVLLIPGIEKDIEKKHVLILNATVDVQQVNTFEELRAYKKKNPDCLIVAAHPFFWRSSSLKGKLLENIDLFDAVEDNYYASEALNWNRKAYDVAEEYNLPVIGTSDTHILKYMDQSYSMIEAEEKTPEAIIKAIKAQNIEVVSRYLSFGNLVTILMNIQLKNFARRALLLP